MQVFCSICISCIWWEINRKTAESTMVLKDLCRKGKKFFYGTQIFALNYNYELIWSTCVLIIIKESVEILHNLNNIKSVPILTHRLDVLSMVILFHGKKIRHIRHLLATVRPRIFPAHFFTIEDISLLGTYTMSD